MADTNLLPLVDRKETEGEGYDTDEYGDLCLSFDDIDDDTLLQSLHIDSVGPSIVTAVSSVPEAIIKSNDGPLEEYILGTLIVRVVAARDLEPVLKHNLGKLLFGNAGKGSGGGGGARTRSGAKGTANPYANVRFGSTTQRTSEAYETTDPTWSRSEAMYMDVTHAGWETTGVDTSEKKNDATKDCSVNAGISSHPGDPPKKSFSHVHTASDSKSQATRSDPILTVAVFHASEVGRLLKFPTKGGSSGDSDDVFLGMTSVDLTHVLTGKIRTFDEWLPLQGTNSSKAAVRVVCEYETSDAPPQPGDVVKFTDFCHPIDLYPAVVTGRVYTVQEINCDEVLIAWTSSGEGWISSFLVHRFMLICVQRHHSVVDMCQDELASVRERIAYSPMVHVVQQSVDRIPDDGLLKIGADALFGGASLLSRWWENGIETTARDLSFATNWDGQHNPNATDSLATGTFDLDDSDDVTADSNVPVRLEGGNTSQTTAPSNEFNTTRLLVLEPLPNMPPCPITGEPMRDPVVAADGHTYERAAIARWLNESNKSPLTGAVLSHKDLVPNYMLLSSLREASVVSISKNEIVDDRRGAIGIESDDDEGTAEVNIND